MDKTIVRNKDYNIIVSTITLLLPVLKVRTVDPESLGRGAGVR